MMDGPLKQAASRRAAEDLARFQAHLAKIEASAAKGTALDGFVTMLCDMNRVQSVLLGIRTGQFGSDQPEGEEWLREQRVLEFLHDAFLSMPLEHQIAELHRRILELAALIEAAGRAAAARQAMTERKDETGRSLFRRFAAMKGNDK